MRLGARDPFIHSFHSLSADGPRKTKICMYIYFLNCITLAEEEKKVTPILPAVNSPEVMKER